MLISYILVSWFINLYKYTKRNIIGRQCAAYFTNLLHYLTNNVKPIICVLICPFVFSHRACVV